YRVYKYGINVTRGDHSDVKAAEEAYNEGNYQQAISLFSKALEKPIEPNPEGKKIFTKEMIQLYLGNAYMNVQQYDKAETSFKAVVNVEDTTFKQDAIWYLGLTYLKMKNKSEARIWLEKTAKGKSIYARDAQAILEEL
ncbi:MAG: tetratricopeptide repeat protein, partial [Flammeovirgaceae bacterium]